MTDPWAESYLMALYQDINTPTWTMSFRFRGDDDASYHTGYVRISEPVEVRFRPLATDEAVRTVLRALDAHEQKLRLELEEKLSQLHDQRKSLLALTHQIPDAPSADSRALEDIKEQAALQVAHS